MPAQLKKQNYKNTYNYGTVSHYPIKKPRKKVIKKRKTNPLKAFFRFIFTSTVLGLFSYYVAPSVYTNYVEPLFVNPYMNRYVKPDMAKYANTTLNYLYNSELFSQHLRVNASKGTKSMIPIISTGELTQLKSELNALIGKYPNLKPSVYVWEYTSAKSVAINADASYPSASIIKLPILFELFRKIEFSKADGSNITTLDKKLLYNDINKTEGSGKLQYTQLNKYYTVDYLAKIMITQSDNSATNMLLEEIGGINAFNSAMRSLGLNEIYIQNRLPDLNGTNRITARQIATLLYNLDNKKYLSESSKTTIKDYMSHVENRSLLQAGLPKDAVLMHKTGDIGSMLGDAGIVYTPSGKKYIVAILVKRPHNDYSARDLIQKASSIIYKNIN